MRTLPIVMLLVVLIVSGCMPVQSEASVSGGVKFSEPTVTRRLVAIGHDESIDVLITGDFIEEKCVSENELLTLIVVTQDVPSGLVGKTNYDFGIEVFSSNPEYFWVAITESGYEHQLEIPLQDGFVLYNMLSFDFSAKQPDAPRIYIDESFPIFEFTGVNEEGEFCFVYPSNIVKGNPI